MGKARDKYRGLVRDGWQPIRQSGSHVTMEKNGRKAVWDQHPTRDLGQPLCAVLAKRFGYTLDQFNRL